MLPFSQEEEVKQGAFLKDDKIVLRYDKEEIDIFLQDLSLGGKHNVYNSMAAALAAKATNVDSAWYALECQKKPVVWIVGGTDKGNDYSVLNDLVREKVKAIVCLGVDNSKIHAAFGGMVATIEDALSAKEAVEKASKMAVAGDVVLLSPCCASFDLFKNYEDRGEQFKAAVRNL